MSLTKFAGRFNATNYAYGLNNQSPPLSIATGSYPAGAATVVLANGYSTTVDGLVFYPPNTNAPITIGSGASAETVTPSAVSNSQPTVYAVNTITATFSNSHGTGDLISSGTCGLQEAINAASAAGGGVVVIDQTWVNLGGTQAMITAATLPTTVTIEDLRNGQQDVTRYASGTIANAGVLALNSAPTTLVAAAGAGTLIEPVTLVLENVFLTAAFAAGGAIGLVYGAGGTACSATAAATFLTSPTANQTILLAGSLASSLSSNCLNKAVVLQAASADFTTGAGSLKYRLSYRIHTGL